MSCSAWVHGEAAPLAGRFLKSLRYCVLRRMTTSGGTIARFWSSSCLALWVRLNYLQVISLPPVYGLPILELASDTNVESLHGPRIASRMRSSSLASAVSGSKAWFKLLPG